MSDFNDDADANKFDFDYEFNFDEVTKSFYNDDETFEFENDETGRKIFVELMEEIPDDRKFIMNIEAFAAFCKAEETCMPGQYVAGSSAVMIIGLMGNSEHPEKAMVAIPLEAAKKLGEIAVGLQEAIRRRNGGDN